VIFGGLFVFKWKWIIYLHLPAVIWGILIEFFRWGCPLTPLENKFRHMAGSEGYTGGFIEHYIIPVVYPADLTTAWQYTLGFIVILVNFTIYGILLRRHLKNR
jgi:hypothetical protein